MVVASNVPAPLNGAAFVSANVELAPWVKLPVKTRLLIVTIPVLLLVSVVLTAGVTEPPNVIALAPARAWVAENAVAPVPLLNVVPLMVIPAPKLVAGFCTERSQTPPEFMVTAPLNVLVPVAAEVVFTVPVIEEVPLMVRANPPNLNVDPVPTVKFPVTTFAAPVVITAVPEILRFPPMVVITGVAVADPLILKSAPIVVTPVIVLAKVPLKPNVL